MKQREDRGRLGTALLQPMAIYEALRTAVRTNGRKRRGVENGLRWFVDGLILAMKNDGLAMKNDDVTYENQ